MGLSLFSFACIPKIYGSFKGGCWTFWQLPLEEKFFCLEVNFIVHSRIKNLIVSHLISWIKKYFVATNHLTFCWMMDSTRLNRKEVFWVKDYIYGSRRGNPYLLGKDYIFHGQKKVYGSKFLSIFFSRFFLCFPKYIFPCKLKRRMIFFFLEKAC